jgi:hypothetical protein
LLRYLKFARFHLMRICRKPKELHQSVHVHDFEH